MKVLIWFLSFFVAAIVNTIIKDLDIAYSLAALISPADHDRMALISGLFSGLLVAATYGAAYYLARQLSKKWEEAKRRKAAAITKNTVHTEAVPDVAPKVKQGIAHKKTWQIVLIAVVVVLLLGSIGMNIYQLGRNNADTQPTEPPKTTAAIDHVGEKLTERAAYILDYYDVRIDNLSKNLSFKSSYFTPIDTDNLGEDSIEDRYKLWLIEKYGYLPANKYGEEKGKAVGNSITTWVADFDRQIEAFRTYTSDYAGISKAEAREFFVDMELWCTSFQEAADSITSTLDSYDEVLNSSWHSRIDTAVEELLKVQEEMLAISEEIYKAKQ